MSGNPKALRLACHGLTVVSVLGCAFRAQRRRVSREYEWPSEFESSVMDIELSLLVIVKHFEAVVCASERMARRYARRQRGFIE